MANLPFWVRWRDAVQSALSAVWRATQARSNVATEPVGCVPASQLVSPVIGADTVRLKK